MGLELCSHVWIALDHVFYFFEAHGIVGIHKIKILVIIQRALHILMLLNFSWARQVPDHPIRQTWLFHIRWRRVKGFIIFLKELILRKRVLCFVLSPSFWSWRLWVVRVWRHQTSASPCNTCYIWNTLMVAFRVLKHILILSFDPLKHSLSRTKLVFPWHQRWFRSALESGQLVQQLSDVSILLNLERVQLRLISVSYHVVYVITRQRGRSELNSV